MEIAIQLQKDFFPMDSTSFYIWQLRIPRALVESGNAFSLDTPELKLKSYELKKLEAKILKPKTWITVHQLNLRFIAAATKHIHPCTIFLLSRL